MESIMKLKVCVPQHWLELFDHPLVENDEDIENYLRQKLLHLHESRASDAELHLFFRCVIHQDKKHGNSIRHLNQECIKFEDQSIFLGSHLSMIRAIALRNHKDFNEDIPVVALACHRLNIPFVKFLLALGFNPNAVDSHGKTGLHYVLESSAWNEQTLSVIVHFIKFGFKDSVEVCGVPRISDMLAAVRGQNLLKERKEIIRHLKGKAPVSDSMFDEEKIIDFYVSFCD